MIVAGPPLFEIVKSENTDEQADWFELFLGRPKFVHTEILLIAVGDGDGLRTIAPPVLNPCLSPKNGWCCCCSFALICKSAGCWIIMFG